MNPADRIRRGLDRVPRWLRAVIGIAGIVLGAAILLRPTTSLGVLALLIGAGLILTGVLGLMGADEGRRSVWRIVPAVLWILAGVFVLSWPGLTVRGIALIVGIGLIVNGVLSLLAAFSRSRTLDARVAAALLGFAGIAFGILALTWPDITLLVVAVVFGAWLIINGILEIVGAVRGTRKPSRPAKAPSVWSRWVRTIGAVVAIVLAAGAASVSAALQEGSPVVDDFYAAPRDIPAEPGQLIRFEPFTRTMPDDALAWRMLYTTTNGDGSPAVASGLVIVPREGDGDWPVIDWTHGTTGYSQKCAPSLLPEVLESGAFMLLPEVLENGWALVATDYIGLGTEGPHPYLIGDPTGRASLDAVRAARQLSEARLGEQTVVWGHSQGGGAALWTGAMADSYASDIPLAGVAALAPASNLPGMMDNLRTMTGGSIFASFVVAAYTSLYDDVTYREYIRPGAEVTVRELAERCLAAPGIVPSLVDVIGTSRDPDIFAKDPTEGSFGERLVENIPPATISAPLLLAQGTADQIVVPAAQDDYVDELCAEGVAVDYRRFAGLDHVPLVEPDSPLVPQLIGWTEARFAGEPVESGCAVTDY
jgi:uncharacterized membrane protein HdeD (DUF308 family)/pimeloyl-ACP methyl ester carboxylesterase